MRNMILVFCERHDALKRHCHVKHYADVSIVRGNRTERMNGIVIHVEPALECGLFATMGAARELLILPGLPTVNLRTLCRVPVPVYVYTSGDYNKQHYSISDVQLLDLGEVFDVVNDGSEHFCPVCGYSHLAEEVVSADGWSYEICPSCGFQFGVDNENGITYEAWRESWVKGGMKWWDDSICHPQNWDPIKQLSSISEKRK